jgi:hypothetical protein
MRRSEKTERLIHRRHCYVNRWGLFLPVQPVPVKFYFLLFNEFLGENDAALVFFFIGKPYQV